MKKYIPKNIWSTLTLILGFALIANWQEDTVNLISGTMILSGAIAYKLAKKRATLKEKSYLSLFFEILFSLIFIIIFGLLLLNPNVESIKLLASRPLSLLIIPLWIVIAFMFIKKNNKVK